MQMQADSSWWQDLSELALYINVSHYHSLAGRERISVSYLKISGEKGSSLAGV